MTDVESRLRDIALEELVPGGYDTEHLAHDVRRRYWRRRRTRAAAGGVICVAARSAPSLPFL